MLPLAELSAAPHLPPALRPGTDTYVLTEFMTTLAAMDEIAVIEENDGLRLVSHAAA